MLLSLDMSLIEDEQAGLNTDKYDLYHLASPFSSSIDDPIIKCHYYVEVSVHYDSCFSIKPTVCKIPIVIIPLNYYVMRIVHERDITKFIRGHLEQRRYSE